MSAVAHQPHRWTRQEYEQLVAAGGFAPRTRVELIEGEILDMAPQNSRHSTALRLVEDVLRNAFGAGYDVRPQLPLALEDHTEPEPDIAVVVGSPRDYRDQHPTTAVLVVEIADSSLDFDRGRKGQIYARNDIPEYWLLNLPDGMLEVYRDPRSVGYADRQLVGLGQSIASLSASEAPVRISDLLP